MAAAKAKSPFDAGFDEEFQKASPTDFDQAQQGGFGGGAGELYSQPKLDIDLPPMAPVGDPVPLGGGGQAQPQGQPPPAATSKSFNWQGLSDDQARQQISDYYSSRGTTPFATSVDYWTGKYGEFGRKDPEYFSRFLSNAEEFTGGPEQTAKAMFGVSRGGGSAPRSGSGAGLIDVTGDPTGMGRSGGQDSGVHDAIMRLLQRGEQPVTEADVASQYVPVRNAMERRGQIARAEAAQRGAVTGTNIGGAGGALEGDVNSLNEGLAQSEGQLLAGLIGDELQGRRADVANALQFAQGEQRMQLQEQLALLDNEIRKQQLVLQGRGLDLQGRSLDLQGRGLDLQGRSLDQADQHFYDTLANDIGNREYLYNQIFGGGLGE